MVFLAEYHGQFLQIKFILLHYSFALELYSAFSAYQFNRYSCTLVHVAVAVSGVYVILQYMLLINILKLEHRLFIFYKI